MTLESIRAALAWCLTCLCASSAELEFIRSFACRIRELYHFCSQGRERLIAEHACREYGARMVRDAAAKALDEEAVPLAVTAHVRHADTNYPDNPGKFYQRVGMKAKLNRRWNMHIGKLPQIPYQSLTF